MGSLGLVDHHQNHIAGIFNRQRRHKTADLGSRQINPIECFLSRPGFATNAIARCLHTFAAALLHHGFHPGHHRAGHLRRQQRCPAGFSGWRECIAGAKPSGDVGTHQTSAIGQHPMQLNQFQRREREPLTEGGGSRLNRVGDELLFRLELTRHSPRKIRVRTTINSETIHPVPVGVVIEAPHRLHHSDIAGHLEDRGEIHQTMGLLVVVVDRPPADGELTDVVHTVRGTNRFLLERQGQIDRLEGGPGLVEILDGPLPEPSR